MGDKAMKKLFGLIFFMSLMLIGTAARAEMVTYEIPVGDSVMLQNISDTSYEVTYKGGRDDFDAVVYDRNGAVVDWSVPYTSGAGIDLNVYTGGYVIITAKSHLPIYYDDEYFVLSEDSHPAIEQVEIKNNQYMIFTNKSDKAALLVSDNDITAVLNKEKIYASSGELAVSSEYSYKINTTVDPDEDIHVAVDGNARIFSFVYDTFEIEDVGHPYFEEYVVDANGMYFTCNDDYAEIVPYGNNGKSFGYAMADPETGKHYPATYTSNGGGMGYIPVKKSEVLYLTGVDGGTATVRYLYGTSLTISRNLSLTPTPTPALTPTPTPTPTPEPTLPPADKTMKDMTVLEIIEEYPVEEDYSAKNEIVLFSNIQAVAVLYNACNAIAEKVEAMSGEEFAEVSKPVDEYLHDVDDAYETLNVEDFPSVEKSETYDELTNRRETVNTKIALEPPKIVSVDNIYPSADFRVEVHSMYTTNSDRKYALEFSNLSSRRGISVTHSSISQNSYSDSVILNSENCDANDDIEIDIIYNGVNCRGTNGCSFTGTVMEDTSSEWAVNEIDAAIALGLVPKELQGNYTSRISRRGFCLLAAAAVEVKTGQTISAYALRHGSGSVTFSDTAEEEIMSSARLGIVNGYEDGTFKPQSDITREQAAAMLARCAKLLGMGYGSVGGTFYDNAFISGWAADSVAFVRSNEIMSGDENNNFMPQGGYTIEQAIATFYRMYNKL